MLVQLNSDQAPNLKSALKHLNRQTESYVSKDSDRTRYLNYDLQILYNHVQEHAVEKVVVLFRDSESFSESLLADLIGVLEYCLVLLLQGTG